MAGNARGKIKEEMEGIHSNLEWIKRHSAKIKDLLGETHPEIHEMCDGWIGTASTWDELLMGVYATV